MGTLDAALIAESFAPESEDNISRTFENAGDRDNPKYVMSLDYADTRFEITHLRRERHQLIGEMIVRCNIPGARTYKGTLSHADFNVSSATVRARHAKLLQARSECDALDWERFLEEFCQRVLGAEREGEPAIRLKDVVPDKSRQSYMVSGLPLLSRHPTILFGDGGVAKSYFALYVAGQLEQHYDIRVGIFDWELAAEDHRTRLGMLYDNNMPNVMYVRCQRPLYYEAQRLRKIVSEEQLEYVILDSITFACDGPPESAEAASHYFQSIRQLGVGSLNLAHISKSGDRQSIQRPFGSIFWHNGARSTYYMQRFQSPRYGLLNVGLYNRKSNLDGYVDPLGFQVDFEPHRTTILPADINLFQEEEA